MVDNLSGEVLQQRSFNPRDTKAYRNKLNKVAALKRAEVRERRAHKPGGHLFHTVDRNARGILHPVHGLYTVYYPRDHEIFKESTSKVEAKVEPVKVEVKVEAVKVESKTKKPKASKAKEVETKVEEPSKVVEDSTTEDAIPEADSGVEILELD